MFGTVWNQVNTVMATSSSVEYNLESSDFNLPQKKKYTRTRSKAYKKRRSARRKKQSFYKRKRLHRFLVHKTKRLQMNSSVKQGKQMLELPTSPSTVVPHEPHRGQSGDEILYWKSRAISLQYENQMLYKHIEQIYSNIISSNSNTIEEVTTNAEDNYENDDQYFEENNYENNEDYEEDPDFNKESRQFRMERDKKRNLKELKTNDDDESLKPPTKQSSEKKESEMKKLYGNEWRKITGMETVVQLNYDLILDKQKINYWPILPIKL